MGLEQRSETLKRLKSHLIVDLHMYATVDGGRKQPIRPGWGCPCFADRKATTDGWTAIRCSAMIGCIQAKRGG